MKTVEAAMRLVRAGSVALLYALIGLCATTGSAATVTAMTEPFRLSIRHDGIRPSMGDETLTYSDLWDGGNDVTVTLAQEGVPLAEGLTGEGARAWSVARNGTYVLTHTTYTNGVAGKVETATFVVTGKDVPFAEGDVTVADYSAKYDGAAHGIDVTVASGIENVVLKYAVGDGTPTLPWGTEPPTLTDVGSMTVWCEIAAPGYITQTNSATVTITKRAVTLTSGDASKVYDGTALVKHEVAVSGDGFVNGEGANYEYAGSQIAVGTSENAFTYTLNEGTKAGNYDITTVNGTLTVTKATVGPGGGGSGGDEPGGGDVPQGGESKFDVTVMYDGEGHTIDTNALVAAFGTAMIGEFAVAYAADDGNGGPGVPALPWLADAPVYTNAGEYVVWYRVTNSNYEDFVHAAKVTIAKRAVTLTSGTKTDFVYDGQPHAFPLFIKSGQDFAEGEGIVASNWATVTAVAEGEVENTFDYVAQEGTDLANYAVTVVTGKIAVVAAPIPVGPSGAVAAVGYTNVYDGAAHGVAVSATGLLATPMVQYRADEADVWANVSPTFGDVCDTQVWYRVSAPNYAPVVGSVGVRITQRPITLTSKGNTKVYDGTPLTAHEVAVGGDGFVDGEGATYAFTGEQTAVGTSENTFTYALNGKTSAGNYAITTVNGTLTVTKASIGGGEGGGEEPGEGDVPDGGLSKFDVAVVYDGVGHTIDTNALVVAFGAAMIGEFAVAYAADDGNGGPGVPALPWLADAPVYTNAGEYVVWYRVTNPNYEDFVHAAKVTIAKRPVTLTSGTKTDFVYDGQPHAFPHFIKNGHDFVAGEGIVASNWVTVTAVAEGEVENTFDYVAQEGTDLANYAVTVVTGKIAVVAAPIPVGPSGAVAAVGYTNVYDGAAHGVAVSANGLLTAPMVQYRADEADVWADVSPTFGDVCDTQVWYRVSAPNYAPVVGSVGVRITPRPITLTSKSETKVYNGTPLTAHEVAVDGDGFVDGEGATYAFMGEQTTVGTSENTFTYTLNENTSVGNYEITTVNGTLTVTKASIGGGEGGGGEPGEGDVPDGGHSKFDAAFVYDGKGHTIDTNALASAFGAAMIGEFAVEYAEDDGSGGPGVPALPWLADAPAYTNAGEYVVWYRVTNPNYEDFVHAAKVTIAKRPVTVTVAGHTATYAYDTTEKSVSGYDAATEDALYDIAADTVFSGTAAASRSDAGTTTMGLAPGDFANSNANFHVTYEVTDGWLRVTPRVIGDDPSNWDIRLARNPMYDGTEQSAPITQVAFVKPDGNLDYIPYELSGNTATDSGNYIVRITGTGNYSGTVEKEWAITPRNVTLSSGGAEWVYDGEAHSQSAVSVTGDGFVAGEGASYSGFHVVRHVSDAAAPTANAFTYSLNANTKAQNYVITTANGTVKMSPRAITLTAPTKEKDYDGAPLTFGAAEVTASLTSGGQGLPALPNGETFTLSNFASITEAGRVDATFTVADGTALMADYAITTVPGTLTVRKNATEITVTAKSGSWVYDGTAHTLHEYEATNLGVLQPGDALDVTFSDESVVTTPMDGAEGNGVVENVITAVRVIRNGKDDVTANYTLAPYNGTLTVTKRPVTLTSKSDSKVYDGEALTAHEIEVGGDGFVGEDGATYVFTGSQTEKGKSRNTFSYSLKGGTNAAFYDITKVEGDLEVTALDIAGGNDEDWEIVLGPALTYTGLEQIRTLASVCYKGLSVDYSVTGNAATDAGAYSMTLAGQGNFSGEKAVSWSIAPKALTLTAGSGSRVYDGTPFTVGAVTAVGFVAGEGAQYECNGAQKDVGSSANDVSAIRWSANTLGSNYTVTKVAGTLTVTPRPVTLTAANISKPYDGAPLALTAADIAADGLVAGESFVYSNFASRTEAGQTPATFDYAPGAGTSLANYTVTVTPGRTVTITKSATAISVTAASESWVYDGEAHSNRTWTATNLDTLQTGDALEVTFDEASVVTTPQDGANGDGTVPNVITGVRVIRSGAEDVTANYTVEWFPGMLAVTKRPVTVTVVGESATYAYDSEEKTVAGYDISTEDELYDVAADTVFGGTQSVSRTDAGKTEMGLSAADFTNDNDCFDVAYAVTDGWVKIVPADIATGAEGDFAIVLGENPKYNGTVQTIPVGSVTYKGMDVTYTLAGENATHAGTYTLTVKANGNFTGERSTTWQVLKRNVTFTSASATKAYDASPLVNPNVTVGGDGFIGIEGAAFDVTGSQTVAGASKNTFSYTLKAGTLAGDYDITKIEGELVVTKANYPGQEPGGAGIKWNVAADAATWMYDGKMHEVSLTGVPAGVTAHISGNAAKDAGEYTASVTFDYDEANFEAPIVPAPLKWTITRRPLSLKTVNAEKPYDGFPLSVEAANITPGMSGYADGECFDYFDLASITEVGETPATFSYRDSATAKVANYAVQVIGGAVLKVTVGGDQISVTAKDGVWCYDGEEHALREWNIVNGDKLIAGHEFQIKIADESVITTPKDGELGDGIVSNRFEYVRIVDTATGADRTRNYNLFLYEGKLQVTNACVGVEMLDGIEDVEKVYDGAATNVVVAADLLQPATVRYCGGRGVSVLPENPQWTDEPLEFTDAGEYAVWYEVTADYYNTYTGKVEVTIAKRPVALTSPTKAKPYDGAALTFDANEIAIGGDGLVDGESFAFSGFASITDAGRVDAAFDYAAGANTSLENYAVTVVAGTLTVNASADEITVTAKSGVWKYDSLAHALHDCEVVNGDVLQSGDELVVEYDAASRVTTPDDGEVENRIVSVKVMRGGAEGEDVTRNYSIAVYPGTLRVVNADVSFGSVDTSAFSTKAVYDGEGHTIAVTAPSLLTSPVTVTYAETAAGPWRADPMAVAVKNAGTHTIRYRVSAKYYNDYIGEATVVITPRKVTLLSAGAKKVFDGTPLRADEVGVKEGSLDFADGEGVDAVCNGSQTGVGKIENGFSYEFRAGTLKDNYTIVPEFGWLEVTPGTLSVDVAGSSYTGVYDGKAHGVTPKFTGTGLNLDACEITYALVAGDESAYAAEMPTFTDVGTYTVYVKIKAQNFEVVYIEMTVTIAPRPVTVSISGKTATFPYDKTEKSVVGYDVASGDALYDVSAGTVFSGTAKAVRTVVGTTAMNLASAQFSNVNGNFTVTYAVTDGWVKIEKSTFDPQDVFGGNGSEESPLVCEKVYDGSAQSVEIKPNFNEEYRFLWSLTKGDESSYSETAPTLRNVADGELAVYFKFVTGNYEPYYGKVIFRILPKTLTDEMVVLTDEAFFFDPESGQKTPSVTVADTNSFGTVISMAADYDVTYGDSTSSAGAVPVTVTGKNNYTGTVTKTFDVLKRPVPPPVIGAKAYNGKNQTATITADDRWMVVENDGGINAGEYPVILRLVNSDDYMWKGTDGKSSDWTGVFRITRGANGWSRAPGIANWTEGETPSEPSMGTPRRGTTSYVTYRRRGADVSTAVREQPSRAGKYTARFVVEETENYVGTFRDVDFEILPGAGGFTETQTTPVPVPYAWLEKYLVKYGAGDYEAAGHAKGANGVALWESYVAGLDPEDATSKFMAFIEMLPDNTPKVTWSPDLSNAEKPRTYTTLGKAKLTDADWTPVTDANKPQMRFFKVKVEMK